MSSTEPSPPAPAEEPPRILVVCPKYLPTEEGLAHYTAEFCRHLAERSTVAVWTSSVSEGIDHSDVGVEVIANVRHWGWLGPFLALGPALRFGPDRVLIQFVPFMYAERGGINFTLVALAWFWKLYSSLRGKGAVEIMFHELWFPFSWKPRAAVMHLLHRGMALGVSLAAERNFCSTVISARLVKDQLRVLTRPVHVLFVGSNLERTERALPRTPVDGGPLRVCIFGSVHPSKNVPMVLRALHAAQRRSRRPLAVTVIGLSLPELAEQAPELAPWFEKEVSVTGHLRADAAADELGQQDLAVCYFSDGVSGRRGSMLAALCEGTPIVTTARDYTDPIFFGQPALALLSSDPQQFERELVALLGAEERPFAGVTREEVGRFYDENFSWRAIVERYLTLSGLPAQVRKPVALRDRAAATREPPPAERARR